MDSGRLVYDYRKMKLNAVYPALLALLTLALAGCGREQLSAEGSVIRFQVNTAEISSSLTKYDLPAVDDVPGDFLRKNGNTVRVWGTVNSAVLFDPYLVLTCDGNGSSASWNYAGDPYYWNMTADYQFRSVFTNDPDTEISSGASASSVTVKYKGGYDLMVAATSLASGDPRSATLYFGHACSAVRFYCVDPTRSSSAATANYNIKRFTLNNVIQTGTLTFGSGMAWTPASPTAEVYSLPAASWPVPSDNDDTAAALTPWFFFVPQNLASSNSSIEFSFAPTGPEYSGLPAPTVDVKFLLKDASPSTWEAGKMYTYFIVLDPVSIGFTSSIQPWPTDMVTGQHTIY